MVCRVNHDTDNVQRRLLNLQIWFVGWTYKAQCKLLTIQPPHNWLSVEYEENSIEQVNVWYIHSFTWRYLRGRIRPSVPHHCREINCCYNTMHRVACHYHFPTNIHAYYNISDSKTICDQIYENPPSIYTQPMHKIIMHILKMLNYNSRQIMLHIC